MNPARSLGPALASGNFPDFWIYLVGPVSVAIAAVPAWQFLRLAKRKPERPSRNHRERSQQRIQPTKNNNGKKAGKPTVLILCPATQKLHPPP